MKVGAIISGTIAAVALGAAVMAFSTTASPYVTIAQAKKMGGDRLHLNGTLDHKTLRNDVFKRKLTFDLVDEAGDRIQVVLTDDMPTNLAEAKNVVAIGNVKEGVFQSKQLIVKCPSKYEADKTTPQQNTTEQKVN